MTTILLYCGFCTQKHFSFDNFVWETAKCCQKYAKTDNFFKSRKVMKINTIGANRKANFCTNLANTCADTCVWY